MLDCSWPRYIPCASSPHLHVAGTQSYILRYRLHYCVAASTRTHERSVGKAIWRVRRAVRVRRRVVHGGRAAGGRAVCRRRALWPQAKPHGNEQLLMAPGQGRTSGCPCSPDSWPPYCHPPPAALGRSMRCSSTAGSLCSRRDCEAPKARATGMALFCWRVACTRRMGQGAPLRPI